MGIKVVTIECTKVGADEGNVLGLKLGEKVGIELGFLLGLVVGSAPGISDGLVEGISCNLFLRVIFDFHTRFLFLFLFLRSCRGDVLKLKFGEKVGIELGFLLVNLLGLEVGSVVGIREGLE